MEPIQIAKEMIGLQKTLFDNTYNAVTVMQQQGEDLLKTTLEQSPWLPISSKNAYLYCADFYSKYLENLKSMADLGFAEIERISSPGSKLEEKESQQTTTTERILPPRPAKKSPAVRRKKVSAKKTVNANTLPGKKTVTQNAPTEKTVIHDRPEVKKSEEVQAATSIPKPSVTSQTTADPALGNKESASKLLPQKG